MLREQGNDTMPKWVCPVYGCDVWVYAPSKQPVHAIAPNPYFQAKDPHCPSHSCELVWKPDVVDTTPTVEPTSIATTASVDQKNGIRVATYNGSTPVYCDYHQRKHISGGAWPGNTPVDSPLFLSSVFNRTNLGLCTLLATTIPWGRIPKRGGGVDAIFNCGATVVGTKGETDILVQGGWSDDVITFHGYPIVESGTQAVAFTRARSSGFYFNITVPT
jgi:hypothetical protein